MSRFRQQVPTGGSGQPVKSGLVVRLRQRDSQVMAEMYAQFGRLIFSVILAIVRDRSRAEDLTQETFVRVWNRAHEFDGEDEHLGRWVIAIARNRAIDDVRSLSSRMHRKTSDIDLHPNAASSADLEREVVNADDARMIRGALSRLDANHQKVIQLAYYERSEEHTSELHHGYISYAVFCLDRKSVV